jgi:hypothetical protein
MKPPSAGHSEVLPLLRKHLPLISRALLAGAVILSAALTSAFAQAGGEVVDVKVTHVASSIGDR